MAIKQTPHAKGIQQAAQPCCANELNTARFVLDLSAMSLAVAATDVAEMGILPMHCRIRSYTLIPENIGAGVNCNVGIMTGTPTDPDPTRTIGTQLFAGQAINNTPIQGAAVAAYNLEPVAFDRSIGLTVDAAIAAGAGKRITLIVDYFL